MIIKICAAYKKTFQRRESLYAHMTRAKRAGELLHTDVIKPISLIDYNRARFIVHNIDNTFKMHFEDYTKEKEKAPRTLRVWVAYLENCTEHNVQHIHLDNGNKYAKLKTWTLKKDILIEPTIPYSSCLRTVAIQ